MIKKVNVDVCTDIDQSKRLLELGISKDTADKIIADRGIIVDDIVVFDKNSLSEVLFDDVDKGKIYPAWSVDALFKLVELAITDSDMFLKRCAVNLIDPQN